MEFTPLPETETDETLVQCSFCNSSQVPADQAFTSPDGMVVICPACVRLGVSQIGAEAQAETTADLDNPRTCSFCGRQQEFTEQILSTGDKTIYICTVCLRDFAARLDAA
jgi:hypothetical protein